MEKLFEKVILPVLIIIAIFVLGIGFSLQVISSYYNAECLQYGYPHVSTTYKLEAYCIREEDEYEIVIPLEDLRKNND